MPLEFKLLKLAKKTNFLEAIPDLLLVKDMLLFNGVSSEVHQQLCLEAAFVRDSQLSSRWRRRPVDTGNTNSIRNERLVLDSRV